jgi:hypothetical protein
VASTCSSPPALASSCWGSGDVGSGSVGSFGAGSSGAGSSGAGGEGAGVAAVSFGLYLMLVTGLMKQN